MREKKMIRTLIFCIVAAGIAAGCGEMDGPGYGSVLNEESTAAWTVQIEKDCGLRDIGRPEGTVREDDIVSEDRQCRQVLFTMEGQVTQHRIDGYAQTVWRACEKAAAADNQSSSGVPYRDMYDARRRQEPFHYFLWYYHVRGMRFRVTVCSTEMETGRAGGIVLKIETEKADCSGNEMTDV